MESKLFYQDSYIRTFRAHVIKHEKDEQGRWFAVLDETAFYPTGGGQPYDMGTLNGIKVVDVEEIEGDIRHYLEDRIKDTGDAVAGEIDWDRRFDHMQQHAGQHILTAAFVELFQFPTIGFHLGRETVTIDLDIQALTKEQALKAEELANQIILEGRPIETKWVTETEAAQYQLRKELAVSENIRLVIIPDFDYNGCGGTHPRSTAEVGAIKILDWERQKNKIRLHFVCGKRVLKELHKKNEVIIKLTELLNAPEADLPATAKKIIENGKEREKSLESLQELFLSYEAKELLYESQVENKNMISKVYQNRSIQELQKLARTMTAQSEKVIVFFANEFEDKLQFVCARGSEPSISMKQISSSLLALINGKGGGSDQFAQGGGEKLMTGEQLLQQAVEKVESK